MQVKDVMTFEVECVCPSTTLQEAARMMRDLDVGPLPVCGDSDRLVGMITDRDIVIRAIAEGQDAKSVRVKDIMTPDVIYCFEDEGLEAVAQKMKENQIRRLLVLNRDKRLVGIVSLGDLAVKASDEALSGETLEHVSEPALPIR